MPTILDLPLYNVLQKLSELKTMIISVVRYCQSLLLTVSLNLKWSHLLIHMKLEDGKQSDDSESDEGEEIWEESDESSS